MQEPRPLFVVGCPRSGTTLLRNMMRAHPNLSFARESHFIPGFYAAYGDPRNEAEATKLVKAILGLKFVRGLGIQFDVASLVKHRSYASLVDAILGTWARHEGKRRWCDKTPQNVQHIETLAKLFPQGKFIHVIRDGRDVARSWLNSPFGPENWFVAASEWQRLVRAGQRGGKSVPPGTYTEIRYETLLDEPETSLRRLCEFIEEPFDPAMLKLNVLPAIERVRRIPWFRPPKPGFNNRTTGIVSGNANKWKTGLTIEQRTMFESVAGVTLSELGYETEGLARPVPGYAQLGWRLHSKFIEALVQLNTQPAEGFVSTSYELTKARVLASRRRRQA